MFSGKTEELIRRLRRYQIAGKRVAAYKPGIDSRYGEKIASHSGYSIDCMPYEDGVDLTADVIGIDEVQLIKFATLAGEFITQLVNNHGRHVICSGLDMTYRCEPFIPMPNLLAVADQVTKLAAVCHKCGNDATLTQRIVNGVPASFSEPTVVVGGLDSYEARCRNCFEVG
jgi:thymidine kinase